MEKEKVTASELIVEINKIYPNLNMRLSEDFNGNRGGVWVNGTEDGLVGKNNRLLFDYYAEDSSEKHYIFGCNKELHKQLEKHGWYAEWYDAGTMFFWRHW